MPENLSPLQFRPMQASDLEQVLQLQCRAYHSDFHEGPDTFAGKLARYPDSAWVAVRQHHLLAYLFAQPACCGLPPPLNDPGLEVGTADALHLHDMAVAPEAQGQGLARRLLDGALAWGSRQGWRWVTLVAVQDSAPYWRRFGFNDAAPEKSLESYGPGAVYLTRPL